MQVSQNMPKLRRRAVSLGTSATCAPKTKRQRCHSTEEASSSDAKRGAEYGLEFKSHLELTI